MSPPGLLFILLALLIGVVAFVLFVVFVMVPVFRGIGWIIASAFNALAFLFNQIFEFIGGMIGDALRFVGAIIPVFILAPLALLNVIIGRWSAAGHFADSVKRECLVAGACLYRFFIRRPLKLFWLHGMLEGVEERMPEAVYGAPTSDKPSSRTGQFDGYTIVGSLRSGGSGGKLYIARPDERKQRRLAGFPDHVVIKCFTLTEGSSLPQIVRESRALEAAKQLGHVLDHGMDEHRFFYVMPYHPGDHLGIITRQMHGESGREGLGRLQLAHATGYVRDLVATLSHYHKGGLWHKDVKPENIIVHDGKAHLVDLGLVTPLKSAMTLTTHGTEYFRDPEMVRQALRGVKVHQVNGAKFDIYAAGAVLYFMLENTFPAHGGLSRFSQKSPEALRWIVRRGMAEYNQRYESADLMLADLQFVLASSDPYAIKPAELPSMRGMELPPEPEEVATVPPLAAARIHEEVKHESPRAHTPMPPRRPNLRVTNWWTGEYSLEDGDEVAPLRPLSAEIRRSAREQIAAARARARELRARAKAHRHKVGIDRQPSAALATILVISLLGLFGLGFLMNTASQRSNARHVNAMLEQSSASLEQSKASLAQTAEATTRTYRDLHRLAKSFSWDLPPLLNQPLLLINDHPANKDPRVEQRVTEIRNEYLAAGQPVAMHEADAEAAIRRLFPSRSEEVEMTALIAAELEQWGFGGILYIDMAPGDGPAHTRVRDRVLTSPAIVEVE